MNVDYKSATTPVTESEGRERVLDEARALFLERGFAEVSMQQIADAAGMTKAALYYHFRNKEDLFVQVVQLEVERFITGITAELEGIDSFEEQLRRIATFVFGMRGSDFGRLIGDFKRHVSEECQEELRRDHEAHDPVKIVRPYFERALANGELRDIDVDRAMMLFFAMLGGLFMISEQKSDLSLSDDLAETMVDAYLHGVGADSRP